MKFSKKSKRKLKLLVIVFVIFYFCLKALAGYLKLPDDERQYLHYIKEVKKDLKNNGIDIEYNIIEPQYHKNAKIGCNIIISNSNTSVVTQQILDAFNNHVNSSKYDLVQIEGKRIRIFIYADSPKYSSWLCDIIMEFDDDSQRYLPTEIQTSINTNITKFTFGDLVCADSFEYVQVACIQAGDEYAKFEREIMPYIGNMTALKSLKFENTSVNLECIKALENLEYLEIEGGSFINCNAIKAVPSLKEIKLNPHSLEDSEKAEVIKLQNECKDKQIKSNVKYFE